MKLPEQWEICPVLKSEEDADAYILRLANAIHLGYNSKARIVTTDVSPHPTNCGFELSAYDVMMDFRKTNEGFYVVYPWIVNSVVRSLSWPFDIEEKAKTVDIKSRLLRAYIMTGCFSIDAAVELWEQAPVHLYDDDWDNIEQMCRIIEIVQSRAEFENVARKVMDAVKSIIYPD